MWEYLSPFFKKIDITNYGILMSLGLLTAIILFWAFCKYLKVDDKTYNFYSMLILISIVAGLGCAKLFQMIYDMLSGISFTDALKESGITFMGGLVGGVIVFVLGTVFFAQPTVKHEITKIVGIAAPCIAAGHCLGRLGCFCVGCCYGKPTDSWIGVVFKAGSGKGIPRIPTQLIEAIFLFVLFIVLLILLLKRRDSKYLAVIYMFAYSIFRFVLEFWRGDDARGLFAALSPSQIQSIIMFLGAVAIVVVVYVFKKVPYGKTGIPISTEDDATENTEHIETKNENKD